MVNGAASVYSSRGFKGSVLTDPRHRRWRHCPLSDVSIRLSLFLFLKYNHEISMTIEITDETNIARVKRMRFVTNFRY
jgi:hypothetical protein